jgi:ferritin
MLSKTLQDAINEQIMHEYYSSYLYLSMAAYFEAHNLAGFGRWMRVQSDEERGHAMKFFDFVLDRGGRVVLHAIAQPPTDWTSSKEVFKQVQEHEQKVTSLINKLYKLALKENDYPTQVLLHWYINEQVEEEKNAAQIVDHLQLIEDRGTAVLMLDKQLGKRGGEAD